MSFICYIDRTNSNTPHMEALVSATLPDARREAEALLAFYESGRRARIYSGDVLLDQVEPEVSVPARRSVKS